MKKIIQITCIGMLFLAFASCEKEEALERANDVVELSGTDDNSSNAKSLKGNGVTVVDGPGITDPGNDDDYDKEDASSNASTDN